MQNLNNSFGLVHDDGFTVLSIANGDFTITPEHRKNADGEPVATGITKKVFHYRVNQSEVDEGSGIITVAPDSSTRVVREIKITIRDTDEAATAARREEIFGKGYVQDFRRFAGLSKSAKLVPESSKLTLQDVENFLAGERTVRWRRYDELLPSTQQEIQKVAATLRKKQGDTSTTSATLAQLAELAALAATEGKSLGPDWLVSFEAAKARVERSKAAKAAKAATKTEATEPVETNLED